MRQDCNLNIGTGSCERVGVLSEKLARPAMQKHLVRARLLVQNCQVAPRENHSTNGKDKGEGRKHGVFLSFFAFFFFFLGH